MNVSSWNTASGRSIPLAYSIKASDGADPVLLRLCLSYCCRSYPSHALDVFSSITLSRYSIYVSMNRCLVFGLTLWLSLPFHLRQNHKQRADVGWKKYTYSCTMRTMSSELSHGSPFIALMYVSIFPHIAGYSMSSNSSSVTQKMSMISQQTRSSSGPA